MSEPAVLVLVVSTTDDRLSAALSDAGYDARVASTVRDALAILESERVHLVLVNMDLADAPRFGVIRAIRAADHTRQVKVLMMANRHSTENEAAAFEATSDDVLLLQPDLTGILARIRSNLHRDRTGPTGLNHLADLPHEQLLVERLAQTVPHQARQSHAASAVLSLALGGFKVFDDRIGLVASDDLLPAVARRLESCLRTSDRIETSPLGRGGAGSDAPPRGIAHVGGNEFAILLPSVPAVFDPADVVERIQLALARPFDINGRHVFVAASICMERPSIPRTD